MSSIRLVRNAIRSRRDPPAGAPNREPESCVIHSSRHPERRIVVGCPATASAPWNAACASIGNPANRSDLATCKRCRAERDRLQSLYRDQTRTRHIEHTPRLGQQRHDHRGFAGSVLAASPHYRAPVAQPQ